MGTKKGKIDMHIEYHIRDAFQDNFPGFSDF